MADQPASRPARRRDFWFAYAAWFVINGIWFVLNLILPGGFAALSVPGTSSSSGGVMLIASGLIIFVNIAVPIVLAFTLPLAALGIVTAICTLLACVVVEVMFYAAGAFIGTQAGGLNVEGFGDIRVGFGFMVIGLIGFLIFAVFVLRAIQRRIR